MMNLICNSSEKSCQAFVTIVSILTVVLSNLTASIPMLQVIKCFKNKSIGTLNPIPFAWLSIVSLNVILYGLFKKDMSIFLSSVAGYFFGLYYTFSLFHLANERNQKWVKVSILVGNFVLFLFAFLAFIVLNDSSVIGMSDKQNMALGIGNSIILISFYLSPFSTIAEVIKTKNSQTINLPFISCAFSASVSWTLYGLITDDLYVFIPQSVAVFCSFLQILCCFVYKRTELEKTKDDIEKLNATTD